VVAKRKKELEDFSGRVEAHFGRYDMADVKYAPSVYDPSFKATKAGDKLKIELATELKDLDIYYSFDNTFPDHHSLKYKGPLSPPTDAVELKVVTYRGKKQMGR
jgi:hexosaminidase